MITSILSITAGGFEPPSEVSTKLNVLSTAKLVKTSKSLDDFLLFMFLHLL